MHNYNVLIGMLEALQGVRQREDYHPEGDAFMHSLQVFSHAIRESKDHDTVLAALLHDIGKATMPIGHEEEAMGMLEGLVSEKTLWLIRNHLRIRYFMNGEMHKLSKIQELAGSPWFLDLVMLARWDKMGRNPNCHIKYDRDEIISRLERLKNE